METPVTFIFLRPLFFIISLFARELLSRKLSIQSINKFQEIGIKTHLAQGFSLQYFTKCLRLIIVVIMIKPEAQIKGTSILYFFFVLVNGTTSKNPVREAKSIKHFKSIIMQFFTLPSRCFQYMTK